MPGRLGLAAVFALQAVELQLASGRVVRIGTNQPHVLEAAIRAIVGHPRPLAPGEVLPQKQAGLVATALGWAVGVGLLVFVTWVVVMLFREPLPPRATVTSQALIVESFLYRTELPLREVTAVDLVQHLPHLRRTSGFAAGPILRGQFDVRGLGNGLIFVDLGNPPFIVVRKGNGFVIVGLDDAVRTSALYGQLRTVLAGTGSR
jgi:hypothetical protein